MLFHSASTVTSLPLAAVDRGHAALGADELLVAPRLDRVAADIAAPPVIHHAVVRKERQHGRAIAAVDSGDEALDDRGRRRVGLAAWHCALGKRHSRHGHESADQRRDQPQQIDRC
ncbi:MAG: hypothetical protein WAL02_20060 [Rhodoplanes sp.]